MLFSVLFSPSAYAVEVDWSKDHFSIFGGDTSSVAPVENGSATEEVTEEDIAAEVEEVTEGDIAAEVEEVEVDVVMETATDNFDSEIDLSVSLFDMTEEDFTSGEIWLRNAIGNQQESVSQVNAYKYWYGTDGVSNYSASDYYLYDEFYSTFFHQLRFGSQNNIVLISQGDKCEVEISNIFEELSIYLESDSSTPALYTKRLNPLDPKLTWTVGIYGINGESVTCDNFSTSVVYNTNNGTWNIRLVVNNPSEDIYRIMMQCRPKLDTSYLAGDYSNSNKYDYGISFGFDKSSITFNFMAEDSAEGLLSGLIAWVKGIFEIVSNGFNSVISGIGNILNSIIELPGKLWTLISEGLQDLFIPTQEDLQDFSQKWEALLQDRLGVIYTCSNYLISYCEAILGFNGAPDSTINLPSVTVNLAGTPFTFGGYDVNIVPDGFSGIVGMLQGLIAIVATLAFVNAMKKRLEKLLGGDGSA